MNHDAIKEIFGLSDHEKISFPDLVGNLSKFGIETYHADLISTKKTCYSASESFSIDSFIRSDKSINPTFDSNKIVLAIRKSQNGSIKYQEFLSLIKQAGVFAYFVFITVRKAIYFGLRGEMHIEEFPS